MNTKHTRRGFTQTVQVGRNMFFTSPLEGEDVRRTDEGVLKRKSLFCTPSPRCGRTRPLPQGARGTARGFTLIELLVVVLIIGILAAVALPQYNKAVIKSKYSTLKHMVDALVQAEEIYYLENGQYTTVMEDLSIEMPNGTLDLDNEYDVENLQQYLYDWGYCQLVNMARDKRAMCIDNSINMGYRRYFAHSAPNNANTRRCDVRETLDETVPQAEVCKIETGSNTRYTSTTPIIQAWIYQ